MSRQSWAVRLGTVGVTEVWLDATWIVVLPLAAWSLAVVYFPENYPVFGAGAGLGPWPDRRGGVGCERAAA